MSTADKRLDEIAGCEFTGTDLAGAIARYATLVQLFARDLARELSNAEDAATAAMRQLQGHPLLSGVDVRWRAQRAARPLREALELCKGISGEMVAFNLQFRAEFAALLSGKRAGSPKDRARKVEL